MARQKESILKTKVLADIRALPDSYAVKIQQVSIRGIPDILACIKGKFVAIELKKSSKEKPEPLQLHELAKIQGAQGLAMVVDPTSWEEALAILKAL